MVISDVHAETRRPCLSTCCFFFLSLHLCLVNNTWEMSRQRSAGSMPPWIAVPHTLPPPAYKHPLPFYSGIFSYIYIYICVRLGQYGQSSVPLPAALCLHSAAFHIQLIPLTHTHTHPSSIFLHTSLFSPPPPLHHCSQGDFLSFTLLHSRTRCPPHTVSPNESTLFQLPLIFSSTITPARPPLH